MATNVCVVARSFRVACVALLGASPALAAQWQNKVSYGGTTTMDLYVPDAPDASPGVVVSLHYCGGNSGNAHGWFQSFADQYGFLIIAPGAGGNCFDASPARSGEREAITKMVSFVVAQHHVDAKRVFAAGASSGACMTNALLAAYPEVFAAGSALAAVPAGAWTGGNAYGWTTPANRSAAQWGDLVRAADPGFSGPRPRVQLWHGTADTTLSYNPNFAAEVAQWTNVLGVSDANATKESFKGSQDTWARTSYEDASARVVLETNVADNAPHDLSGRGLWRDVVRFFGLDRDVPSSGGAGGAGGASGGSGGAAAAGGAANGGVGGTPGGASTTGGAVTGGGASSGGQPSSAGSSSTVAGAPTNAGAPSGGSVASGGAASAGAAALAGSRNLGDGASDGGGCTVGVTTRQCSFSLLALAGAAWLRARRRRSA